MPRSENPLNSRRSSTISPIKRNKPAEANPRLDDIASITSIPPDGVRQDVLSLMQHTKETMFDELPERAGMSSTQIASTLRFRAALPPLVSLAHLYATSTSTTVIDREIARLTAQGVLRKISIPGRGKGGTAIGDAVAQVSDWKSMIDAHTGLMQETKDKYNILLTAHPTSSATPTDSFTEQELQSLIMAGFFTSPSTVNNLFAPPTPSLLRVSSAGYSAATGTLDAVGGRGVIHESGAGGNMLATSETRQMPNNRIISLQNREMNFSLPNTGAYLKLLANSRAHLVHLIKQVSPKWRESTLDLLLEKWDGGLGNALLSEHKRMRGESNGLLPGKTRKWRDYYGLGFDFVLAEAVGSAVIELFDTGAVGLAVRLR